MDPVFDRGVQVGWNAGPGSWADGLEGGAAFDGVIWKPPARFLRRGGGFCCRVEAHSSGPLDPSPSRVWTSAWWSVRVSSSDAGTHPSSHIGHVGHSSGPSTL